MDDVFSHLILLIFHFKYFGSVLLAAIDVPEAIALFMYNIHQNYSEGFQNFSLLRGEFKYWMSRNIVLPDFNPT